MFKFWVGAWPPWLPSASTAYGGGNGVMVVVVVVMCVVVHGNDVIRGTGPSNHALHTATSEADPEGPVCIW